MDVVTLSKFSTAHPTIHLPIHPSIPPILTAIKQAVAVLDTMLVCQTIRCHRRLRQLHG